MNLRTGTGIKLPDTSAPEAPPAVVVDTIPAGDVVWVDTPSFSDQLAKYPRTTRMGPEEFECFIVTFSEERARYLTFLKSLWPETAPAVRLISPTKEHFSSHLGTLTFTVRFRRVEYMKLRSRPS